MKEETTLFLSHFNNGIRYLHGGAESGFKHYTPEVHEPKLYRVHGKRYPRCFEMEVKATSLNQGDSFVLDLNEKLYIWSGSAANKYEKVAAMNFANGIKNGERHGGPELIYPQDRGG